jgi:hypothetical protein
MHLIQVVLAKIYFYEVFRVVILVVVVVVVGDVAVVELYLILFDIEDALLDVSVLFGEYDSLEVLVGLLSIDL